MAKLLLRICLILGMWQAQLVFAEEARVEEKVSFYFAAHQDDWQLFMNPSAFIDIADTKTRTVFVHLTAGDAGLGVGGAGRKHPYYLARENGAEAAIRFMADSDSPREKIASHVNVNGHKIYRVSYRNTVTYFLRVPDGSPSGAGYRQTGHQSLQRLANGENTTLTAIDGSTVYRGWTDLVATLRAIMDHERGHSESIKLNVGELDTSINPGDHSDHRMTAKAALDAARGLDCARRLHYVNYASSRLKENLSSEQRDMESSVLAVTAAGVLALDHGTLWQRYFKSYLGRSYFRVEEGTGRCEEPRPQSVEPLHTIAGRQQLNPAGKSSFSQVK